MNRQFSKASNYCSRPKSAGPISNDASTHENHRFSTAKSDIEALERRIHERLSSFWYGNAMVATIVAAIIGSEMYVSASIFNVGLFGYLETFDDAKTLAAILGSAVSLLSLIAISSLYRAICDIEGKSIRRELVIHRHIPYLKASSVPLTNAADMIAVMSKPLALSLFWPALIGCQFLTNPLYFFEIALLLMGLVLWPLTSPRPKRLPRAA